MRSCQGVLLTALVAVLVLGASPAQAGHIVTFSEVGSDVVAIGSGPIDLTGLVFGGTGVRAPFVAPFAGILYTGAAGTTDLYGGAMGPSSFGSGSVTQPDTASGDLVGIDALVGVVNVTAGYVSGSALSNSATYLNQTFATLGLTPGTYVYSWGDDENTNLTVLVSPTAIPEPGTFLLIGSAVVLGSIVLRRRLPKR